MKKDNIDVYSYYKDYTTEDLYRISEILMNDIQLLKLDMKYSKLDTEVEKLRYVNNLIKERKEERLIRR